jgi:hypothetical protein
MPGAWEERGPEVLVAVLTRETVAMAWAWKFRDLDFGPASGRTLIYGAPFDHARNMACERALQGGFEWLFFIDDDVIPPVDAFRRLASRRLPIISGLYYRRNLPIVPVMLKANAEGAMNWITDFQPGSLLEVDMVGAGCLLIHTSVLRAMKSPWFDWRSDHTELAPGERLSEDFAFCADARKKYGYKIHMDTSVQCLHCGYARAGYGSFGPLTAEGNP